MERIKAEVKVVDAVVHGVVELKIDLIAELKELAKKTDNTIDDQLVNLVELARQNLDWKGVAKAL